MSKSLSPTIRQQIDWMVKHLCTDFDGRFERSQIEEIMNDSVQRIVQDATVFDFVPLMAYRFTRERLNAIRRAQSEDAKGTSLDTASVIEIKMIQTSLTNQI